MTTKVAERPYFDGKEEDVIVEKDGRKVAEATILICEEIPTITLFGKEAREPKGTGSLALRKIEQYLKSQGFRQVWITSFPWTHGFYTKNGYKIMDHEPLEVYLQKDL